jgi:hypothetical protein
VGRGGGRGNTLTIARLLDLVKQTKLVATIPRARKKPAFRGVLRKAGELRFTVCRKTRA